MKLMEKIPKDVKEVNFFKAFLMTEQGGEMEVNVDGDTYCLSAEDAFSKLINKIASDVDITKIEGQQISFVKISYKKKQLNTDLELNDDKMSVTVAIKDTPYNLTVEDYVLSTFEFEVETKSQTIIIKKIVLSPTEI